ncbi:MAG: hypothetical protein IJP87_01810 [Campylobacter sp.]|nr:hypothetical protein [Campylobacter sp.]
MANKIYKLGKLMERRTANNKDLKYGTDLIAGVSNEGIFTSPICKNKGQNYLPKARNF